MRFFDFFAGIGGFRLSLERAGHVCVGASEVSDFPRAVYEHRFGHAPAGDMTQLRPEDMPAADLWCGGWPCFPEGTPVIMENGEARPIESVHEGERVLTHAARYRRVTCTMRKHWEGELVTIKATSCLPIKCTPEHPIYTRTKRSWSTHKHGRSVYKTELGDPAWTEAKDVRPGMLVWVPVGRGAPTVYESGWIDTDLWWAVGFYLAEGWRSRRMRAGRRAHHKSRPEYRITFSCNDQEKDVVLKRLSSRWHVTVVKQRTAVRLIVNSMDLWSLLAEFGDGAANKRIPSWAFSLPHEAKQAILAGFLDGDATAWRDKWKASTVSLHLALGVQRLALDVEGRMPSLYAIKPRSRCMIEGREVRERPWYQLIQQAVHRSTLPEQNGAWCLVRKVGREQFSGDVFNLSVDEDESYTAGNMAVHNCQGLSQAGLRKGIFGDPRSNLIWPLLDLADRCEANGNGPTWLLLENVPGLLNGKDYECGEDVYGGKPEDACPACGRPLGDAAAGHVQRPWIGEVFGALADRGWRWAWRVLDAQFFGVAQHRERIFILARRAGASGVDPTEVLLEPPSMRGDPRARGAQGAKVAGTVTCGTGSSRRSHDASGAAAGHLVAGALVSGGGPDVTKHTLVPDVARTLCSSFDRSDDGTHNTLVGQHPFAITPEHGQGADLRAVPTDVAPTLVSTESERGVRVVAFDHQAVTATLRPEEAGGQSAPAVRRTDDVRCGDRAQVTIAFDRAQVTHPENRSRCDPDAPVPALAAQNQLHVATFQVRSAGSHADAVAAASDVARTLDSNGPWGGAAGGTIVAGTADGKAFALMTAAQRNNPDQTYAIEFAIPYALGVRRLTPRECERLQGFPDDWTLVPNYVATLRGKRVSSDTKRYEALGNSVAVPVVEWIGRRLAAREST